jgi:hypothetical protein
MRNRFFRAGANLLLLCSAVAFSLLLAELALRLFYHQKMRIEFDAYAGVPGTRYDGLRPNYRKRFSHDTNFGKMDGRLRRLLELDAYTSFRKSGLAHAAQPADITPWRSHEER